MAVIDLKTKGTLQDGGIRKITADESANSGDTTNLTKGSIVIFNTGIVGAKAGGTCNLKDSLIIVDSTSTLDRAGALSYETDNTNHSGADNTGKLNVLRCVIMQNDTSDNDSFFSKLEHSSYYATDTSASQLIRFQDGGTFANNYCDFSDAGSVELHGTVTISNNQLKGLKGGFINYSTGQMLNIEKQNFLTNIQRLGFTNNGGLNFIDCMQTGVFLTESQIKAAYYTLLANDSSYKHCAFSKRQNIKIVDALGASIATAKIEYQGAGITTQSSSNGVFNGNFRLMRTNAVHSNWAPTAPLSSSDFQLYIDSSSNKITREIKRYGYQRQIKEYTSYDNFETFNQTSATLLTLTIDNRVVTSLTEASITALANVSVNFASKTVTISGATITLDQLCNKCIQLILAGFNNTDFIAVSGTELSLGDFSLTINSGATLNVGTKYKSLKTTSTVVNNGTANIPYVDVNGLILKFEGSSNFNLAVEDDGSFLTFQSGVNSASYVVQPASVIRYAFWIDGYQPVFGNFTANSPRTIKLSAINKLPIDTAQNVSTLVNASTVSYTATNYIIIFNQALTESSSERLKNFMNRIIGQQKSLEAFIKSGGVDSIEINAAGIRILNDKPQLKVNNAVTAGKVELNIYIDTSSVTAGGYDLTPVNSSNIYVNYLKNPAIVDNGAISVAVKNELSSSFSAIQNQTDKLRFTGNDIKATLDGEEVDIGKVKGVTVTSIADFKGSGGSVNIDYSQIWQHDISSINNANSSAKYLKDTLSKLNTNLNSNIVAVGDVSVTAVNDFKADITTLNNNTTAIKNQTDKLRFTGNDIKATLDGEEVDIGKVKGVTVTSIADFKTDVSTLNSNTTAIKAKTDNLPPNTATELTAIRTKVHSVQDSNIVSVQGTAVTSIRDFQTIISSDHTAIASAVWNASINSITITNSAGKILNEANNNAKNAFTMSV